MSKKFSSERKTPKETQNKKVVDFFLILSKNYMYFMEKITNISINNSETISIIDYKISIDGCTNDKYLRFCYKNLQNVS